MITYKSEIMNIPYKLMRASLGAKEVNQIDEFMNARAQDGWKLVTHSFLSGDSYGYMLLVTFGKEE